MSSMMLEAQQGMQTKPNPGLFKRNPPIAGEAEAIERAKEGDPDAFSKLYALHKRRVYTLCLRMLGNVSEAEDMTQEAFLHLFRKLGSFRDQQLAGSVDRVTLERAVSSLPPGYRMVFVLHDVEGFEHNEIASMLECSTGNSKSQLHKARLKLRELLRNPEQLAVPAPGKEGV